MGPPLSVSKDSGKAIFLSLDLVLLCHGQWEEKRGVPRADGEPELTEPSSGPPCVGPVILS